MGDLKKRLFIIPVILVIVLIMPGNATGSQLRQKRLILGPAEGSEFIGPGGVLGVKCPNMEADGEIYWSVDSEAIITLYFITLSDWNEWNDVYFDLEGMEGTERVRVSGTHNVTSANTWVVVFKYDTKFMLAYNFNFEYKVDYWEGGDAPKPSQGIPGFEFIPLFIALRLVIYWKKRRSY